MENERVGRLAMEVSAAVRCLAATTLPGVTGFFVLHGNGSRMSCQLYVPAERRIAGNGGAVAGAGEHGSRKQRRL